MTTAFDKVLSNINNSLLNNSPPEVTYIIGNNGTGKSRLLNKLSLHYEDAKKPAATSILYVSNAIYDRYKWGVAYEKIVYLGARGNNNAIFHSTIDRQIFKFLLAGILWKKTALLNFLREKLKVEFFVETIKKNSYINSNKDISNLVDNRKLPAQGIGAVFDKSEIAWLRHILDSKINVQKLTKQQASILQKFANLNPTIKIYANIADQEIEFQEFSSGQQNRILLALKILSHAKDGCIVLIDEPEISLHLHWQMEFHEFIKGLMENYKNYHVVIATHSPFIISEAAKDNASDAIIMLESASRDGEDFREAKSKDIESCDELMLDYFDTVTYNTKTVDQEIAEILLRATESHGSDVDNEKTNLNKLLSKTGISPESRRTVAEAIKILNRYIAQNKK